MKSLEVTTQTLSAQMYHKDALILTYKIQYPQFASDCEQAHVCPINQHYAAKAQKYVRLVRSSLYTLALRQYEYDAANGYPVRTYDAAEIFRVTLNQDCTLSLYIDHYEYTGGAHGNTVRTSDTWNVQTGCRDGLNVFVPYGPECRVVILEEIIRQIETDSSNYFTGYKKNVRRYFDPHNFYLTPQGIVFYYQQYEIAPYASGIPTFTIPYSDCVNRPFCD